MPFIEQMLFGVNLKDENPERSVLAHSPGMSMETTAEIVRLCENLSRPLMFQGCSVEAVASP